MKKPKIENVRKKRSKSTLRRLLDTEWSRVIRLRERCARCSTDKNLQAAHIFSRRNLATRWDLDNGLPLCYACHFYWAHKEPVYFMDLVKEYLGEVKLMFLRQKASSVKKWTVEEMEDCLKALKSITEKI